MCGSIWASVITQQANIIENVRNTHHFCCCCYYSLRMHSRSFVFESLFFCLSVNGKSIIWQPRMASLHAVCIIFARFTYFPTGTIESCEMIGCGYMRVYWIYHIFVVDVAAVFGGSIGWNIFQLCAVLCWCMKSRRWCWHLTLSAYTDARTQWPATTKEKTGLFGIAVVHRIGAGRTVVTANARNYAYAHMVW